MKCNKLFKFRRKGSFPLLMPLSYRFNSYNVHEIKYWTQFVHFFSSSLFQFNFENFSEIYINIQNEGNKKNEMVNLNYKH